MTRKIICAVCMIYFAFIMACLCHAGMAEGHGQIDFCEYADPGENRVLTMTRFQGDAIWPDSLTVIENGQQNEFLFMPIERWYLEELIIHCEPDIWDSLPIAASPDEQNAKKLVTVRYEDGTEFVLTGNRENSAEILEKISLFLTSYTKDAQSFEITFLCNETEQPSVIPVFSAMDHVTWVKTFRYYEGSKRVSYSFFGRIPGKVDMFLTDVEETFPIGNEDRVIYTLEVDDQFNLHVEKIAIDPIRIWAW